MTERISFALTAAFWAAMFLLLPALVARHDGKRAPSPERVASRPMRPPPKVEPLVVKAITAETARTINAAIPFSLAPNPPARPFVFGGSAPDRDRAVACLASAQYYEAGDDPVGQRSVAQVVLNRLRHPAFPKSVCGVVFQGSERVTGCQFTFTCDGALARTPSPAAWDRAKTLADKMLSGEVYKPVGTATHYHTDWVVPYWSSDLDKIAQVQTHLFFRWRGFWGTRAAFVRRVSGAEPNVPQIARLSLQAPAVGAPAVMPGGNASALAQAPRLFDQGQGAAQRGVRLIAASPADNAFIIELVRGIPAQDYAAIARTFCSGRSSCRIMGWNAGSGAPGGFPIPSGALPSMLFSYIHDAKSGLQRLLWNCRLSPPPTQDIACMRERVPMSSLAAPTPSAPINAARTSPAPAP